MGERVALFGFYDTTGEKNMKAIKEMFWKKSVLVNFTIGILCLLIGLAINIIREGGDTKFCIGLF